MHTDYNIYTWHVPEGVVVLGLFVDDIPLIASTELALLKATDCLSAEFPITNKGPMNYFLGIEVIRDPHGQWIKLSQ